MEKRNSPTARIPAFIARLRALDKSETKSIWGLCMAEKGVLKRTGHAITSQRRVLTEYRNAVRKQVGVTSPALAYLQLSLDDMEGLRDEYLATVIESHTNLRPLDAVFVVERATSIVKEPRTHKVQEVVAALLLLTGRRVTEIWKTAEFHPSDKKKTVYFLGQLKTKENEAAPAYLIPILAEPAIIMAALDNVRARADCTDLDNDAVHNRYSKPVNAATALHFADDNGVKLTPKDLRAAYAAIAYGWYAPVTITTSAYYARSLGHSPLDLITSLSYEIFYLKGQKRAYVADYRWSLDVAMALQEDAFDAEPDPIKQGYIRKRIETLQALADAT